MTLCCSQDFGQVGQSIREAQPDYFNCLVLCFNMLADGLVVGMRIGNNSCCIRVAKMSIHLIIITNQQMGLVLTLVKPREEYGYFNVQVENRKNAFYILA